MRSAIDWTLTQESFDRLLQWLDPEPAQAARRYEEIRRSLVKFFECRACISPEEETDRCIDRVARKLGDGVEIVTDNRFLYFYGVALNVFQEYLRRSQARIEIPLPLPEETAHFQRRLACMEHCLALLPSQTRQLMIDYCTVEKASKKRERSAIAERLGVSLNNLRIRVHRVREQLERCVTVCLSRSDESA
jgi:hypothetical protein